MARTPAFLPSLSESSEPLSAVEGVNEDWLMERKYLHSTPKNSFTAYKKNKIRVTQYITLMLFVVWFYCFEILFWVYYDML